MIFIMNEKEKALKLLEQIIEKNQYDDFERQQIGESWNTYHLKQLLVILKSLP